MLDFKYYLNQSIKLELEIKELKRKLNNLTYQMKREPYKESEIKKEIDEIQGLITEKKYINNAFKLSFNILNAFFYYMKNNKQDKDLLEEDIIISATMFHNKSRRSYYYNKLDNEGESNNSNEEIID